jgi:hypothetical protein
VQVAGGGLSGVDEPLATAVAHKGLELVKPAVAE